MRNFLKLGFAAIALIFLFNTFAVTEANAQKRPPLQEALKRMDDHNKALESLKASVRMEKYNTQIDEKDINEGSVTYLPQKKGNPYVRIDWTKPMEESLAVANGQYVIYRKRLNQVMKGSVEQAKGSGKANSALAFINMSKAQLQANYTIRYVGQEDVSGSIGTWHLELTPKTKTYYKTADIWVDKDGMPVMAKVTETNNDTTTVFLSNIKKNEMINASVFTIPVPKDAKLIK
ncbi:MAG: outer-membrane lipoprotein carrier protein LolA [Pyrinomonadaceae bacterium]